MFQRKHLTGKMGNSSNKQLAPIPSIYHDVDKMIQTFSVEESKILNHLQAYRRAGEQEPQKKTRYENYSGMILDDIAELKRTLHEAMFLKQTFKLHPEQNGVRLFELQEKAEEQYVDLKIELYQYFSIGFNPLFATIKSKSDDEDEECIVCFEQFSLNRITDLEACPGCKHHYHAYCINDWLEREGTCPMCRATIEERHHIELKESKSEWLA